VLAVATMAAVLTLLLMSMPRLRWWDRRGRPGQRAQHAGAQPAVGKSLAPSAAGEPSPRPGVPARPG